MEIIVYTLCNVEYVCIVFIIFEMKDNPSQGCLVYYNVEN